MELQTALNDAIAGRLDALHAFLAAGGDANAPLPGSASALHWLAQKPWAPAIDTTVDVLLKKGGAKPDVRDAEGRTPLHHAARVNLGVMKRLLQAGAEIDARDSHGVTPLHVAVEACAYGLTEALAFLGADANLTVEKDAHPFAAGEDALAIATRGRLPSTMVPLVRRMRDPRLKEATRRSATFSILHQYLGATAIDVCPDVEAWLLDGNEGALARASRIAPTAQKREADMWHLLSFESGEPAQLDRCFILAAAAFDKPKAMYEWIVKDKPIYAGRLVACARWLETRAGPPTTPHVLTSQGSTGDALTLERSTVRFASALKAHRPDHFALGLAALFRSLKTLAHYKEMGWRILGQLGATETEVSAEPTSKKVRQLGPVVVSEERKGRKTKVDVKIVKDEAAAIAHVASLSSGAPPPTPKPRTAPAKVVKLEEDERAVSLWADATLDPKGTLDGAGGPVGWFDHDNWETVKAEGLSQLSYAASFAAAVQDRLRELGLPQTARIDALFGYRLPDAPGQKPYGWFIGTFPYEKRSAS